MSSRKKSIAEHFCCGNMLSLLIRLEKFELVFLESFLRNGSVLSQQKCSTMDLLSGCGLQVSE